VLPYNLPQDSPDALISCPYIYVGTADRRRSAAQAQAPRVESSCGLIVRSLIQGKGCFAVRLQPDFVEWTNTVGEEEEEEEITSFQPHQEREAISFCVNFPELLPSSSFSGFLPNYSFPGFLPTYSFPGIPPQVPTKSTAAIKQGAD
jgi:hypothetical protein